MTKFHILFIAAAAIGMLLLATTPAAAAPPTKVPVQGVLADADGLPVDGMLDVVFTLYSDDTGSTVVWSEMQTVAFERGFFSVYLGAQMSADHELFRDNDALYLGISVDGDDEMNLVEIATAPFAAYAQYAANAGTLEGLTVNDLAAADHRTDWGTLDNIPSELADGDDDSTYSAVANGGLELSANNEFGLLSGCANGEVLKQGPSGWDCATDDLGSAADATIANLLLNGTVLEVTEGTTTTTVDLAPLDSDTTYAAGTGISLTGTTFSADTGVLQARVVNGCAAGSSIRSIAADGSVTCHVDTDTDTNTTYNAGNGLNLVGTTFTTDDAYVQRRVSGTCAAGFAIRSISAAGIVVCEPDTDTDTTYSAGSGVTLTGTTFSANTSVVQARVVGTCPVGSSIRTIAANGSVTCEVDSDSGTAYTAGNGLNLTGSQFALSVTGDYSPLDAAEPTGSALGAQSAAWFGQRFRIVPEAANPAEGRLEFSPDDGVTWGTVCDDLFDSNDNAARVVCRSMGYADGTLFDNTLVTDGTGTIYLDDFGCGADARNFMECRIRPIGQHNCTHSEDVGVSCTN